MNNRTLICCIQVFLLAFICSCAREQAKPLPVLRIAHAPHDHHAPLYIAAMNPDYFRDHGGIFLKEIEFKKQYELIANDKSLAKVQIDSSTGGKKLIKRLAENLDDLSFGGVPAILSFIDQGKPIKILLPVNGEGAGLVMSKTFPGDSWADFINYVKTSEKPVRIGYKISVSVQNLIFESALASEHISFSRPDDTNGKPVQVELVNLYGAKNLIPALKNKLIDGFVIMQPFLALAEAQGVGKTIAQLSELPPNGKWKGNPCCAVAGRIAFVKQHQKIVTDFLTLLARASIFIQNDPETSAHQIAKWLGTSYEVERASIPTIAYTTEFNKQWEKGVDFWVEQMVASGKLNHEIKAAYEQKNITQKVYDLSIYQKALQGILAP